MIGTARRVRNDRLTRRRFCAVTAGALASAVSNWRPARALEHLADGYQLKYIVSAAMYGTTPLAEVLGEVRKTGSDTVDIWPMPHGNHREQMDDLGLDAVEALLQEHGVRLGVITRYDLGPYRLQQEFPFLKRLGGKILVCGATPQEGDSEKERVRKFVESMKPHVSDAEESGITIGIENHSGSILNTPSAVRYFAELSASPNLGLAMAPYHLPQDPAVIASLVEDLGDKLVFFQAWEHGKGCTEKLPKEEEMMQMPGRGRLDFIPILAALKKINYQGWTEVFMHPVPRGVPIRETTDAVTAEINEARKYLDSCLKHISA